MPQVLPSVIHDVAEKLVAIDKEVTRVDVPIVFDHEVLPAVCPKHTAARGLSQKTGNDVVEVADGHGSRVAGYPFIENSVHERTPVLRAYRIWCGAAVFLELDAGDVLMVPQAELVTQIPVHLARFMHVRSGNQGKNVVFDAMPFQGFEAAEHIRVAAAVLSNPQPVGIMDLRGTVNAYAHQETGSCKVPCKIVRKKSSVGLQSVGYN